mgnify:CR=1 FL=1
MPADQAGLSGKRSVHIADLVTVASSYIRAWIPAVEALGYGLTDVGLHNSIISVIDFFADGEVYPVGRMERSGER